MKVRNSIFMAITLIFTVLAVYGLIYYSMLGFVFATLAAASLSLTVISISVGYLHEGEHQWFTITDWFMKTMLFINAVTVIIVICGWLSENLELFALSFSLFIAVIPTEAAILILVLPIRCILKRKAVKNDRLESSGKP